MAGAGRRVLGPGHARVQTADAAGEGVLVLVQDGQLILAGQFTLLVAGAVQDGDGLAVGRIAVGAQGRPVLDVLGQQVQPVVEASGVQQPRLPVQELLNLADGIVAHWWFLR